ncbi:MAG: thioesterase [Rhodospirillaceae bacterium]|nr:thioesterase [Rhodospirillaceae bacterium]|tara:strand:+ start:7939 stop:8358 length:420 start_codon:yes stop_codon:yes gene_type:complete
MTEASKEEKLREWLATGPFQEFLGLELISSDLEKKELVLRLPYKPEFERLPDTGQIHGGVTSALIDVAGDFALIMSLERPIPTINLRIDYLSMGVNTDLIATSRVVRAGRSIGVVDVTVTDESEKIIAVGRGCYSTLDR